MRGRKPKQDGSLHAAPRRIHDEEAIADVPYDGPRPAIGRVPAATKRWWDVVSRMPHCVLWSTGDWQRALDTAVIHQAFVRNPTAALASELRQREHGMGVTFAARRDLRIRYVPQAEIEEPAAPASLSEFNDERRRRLAEGSD